MDISYIRELSNEFVRELTNKKIDFNIRVNKVSLFHKNKTPIIAITIFNLNNENINIHFGNHFNVLNFNEKINVIKHECCHISDVFINGIHNVLKQDSSGHGKTFYALCNRIGCPESSYIDHKDVVLNNKKIKYLNNLVIEKGRNVL